MATDKNVLRFRDHKAEPARGRRRTKKGHKRDKQERFWIQNGAVKTNA